MGVGEEVGQDFLLERVPLILGGRVGLLFFLRKPAPDASKASILAALQKVLFHCGLLGFGGFSGYESSGIGHAE